VAERYFRHKDQTNSIEQFRNERGRYTKHISGSVVGSKPLGVLTSSVIRPEHIESLQNELASSLSPKSVNNVTNLLRTILLYGLKNQHCKKNFMGNYKPLPVENEIERVFTADEIGEMIESATRPYHDEPDDYPATYAKERLQMFIRLMYYTAQRPESLLRLQCRDIEWDDNKIRFAPIKKQKTNRVPIHDKLKPHLEKWVRDLEPDDYLFHPENNPSSPLSRKTLLELARRFFSPYNAGLDFKRDRAKWATLYTLRHSAATIILQNTDNIALAQAILGHSDVRITKRYVKVADGLKERGIAAL
jgi:integrase